MGCGVTAAAINSNRGRPLGAQPGIVCDLCHQEAVINVDRFGDDVPVPGFGPRMVCIGAVQLAGARDAGELDGPAVAMSGPEAPTGLGARWPVAVGAIGAFRSGPS